MAVKPLPSQRLLLKLLSFDPGSGVLTWRPRPKWMFFRGRASRRDQDWKRWATAYARKPVSGETGKGYRTVNIFGHVFMVHRVIWKMVHGADPVCIDHINRIRHDNRLSNLRNILHEENQYNQGIRIDNSSGTPGVYWLARRGVWKAQITKAKQKRTIGYYKNKSDAVAARAKAERDLSFFPISL